MVPDTTEKPDFAYKPTNHLLESVHQESSLSLTMATADLYIDTSGADEPHAPRRLALRVPTQHIRRFTLRLLKWLR